MDAPTTDNLDAAENRVKELEKQVEDVRKQRDLLLASPPEVSQPQGMVMRANNTCLLQRNGRHRAHDCIDALLLGLFLLLPFAAINQ